MSTTYTDELNGTQADAKLTSGQRRAIFAATLGTLIEWYDYALYGVAAGLVISPLFFPQAIGNTAAIVAFATFAVGFLIRPIGGLVIAHIGDTIGRKPALILTIVLMGIATTAIGFLQPPHKSASGRRSCWCSFGRCRASARVRSYRAH